MPRIAYLSVVQTEAFNDAFRQGLADFGYVDGRSVIVSYFAAPTITDVPAYAARAIAGNPDLISTSGSAGLWR